MATGTAWARRPATKTAIAVALLAGAWLTVSAMSRGDAERDRAHYCSMVTQEAWPNFKHRNC